MRINRDNYEMFMADYIDGLLDPVSFKEMVLFLEQNPDIKAEIDGLVMVRLDPRASTAYPAPENLKRSIRVVGEIREDNIEDYLVAELEGVLSVDDARNLQEFLALNPVYDHDRRLFGLTKSGPDHSLLFPFKDRLKKKPVILPLPRIRHAGTYTAVAAVVLLALVIHALIRQDPSSGPSQMFKEPVIAETAPVTPPVKSLDDHQVTALEQGDIHSVDHAATVTRDTKPAMDLSGRENPIHLKPLSAMVILDMSPGTKIPMELKHHFHPEETGENMTLASAAGKVFVNLVKQGGEIVAGSPSLKAAGNKPGLWKLASLGLEWYGKMADKDLGLDLEMNETGQVTSYALLEDKTVVFTRSRPKE